MKQLDYIVENYRSQTLDGRDMIRLLQFLTEEQAIKAGYTLDEEYRGKHKPIPFTRENILIQLEEDVSFGFEKALNQRGISSSLMFNVVSMWNWVLEEGLEDYPEDSEHYAQYGLPLFKATAIKYGWENPIGDKVGNEREFESE